VPTGLAKFALHLPGRSTTVLSPAVEL